MAAKLKNPQSLSIILGGGIVAITVAGFLFALAGAGLPVGAELDAIGRVEVDHLDLAAEVLALGE